MVKFERHPGLGDNGRKPKDGDVVDTTSGETVEDDTGGEDVETVDTPTTVTFRGKSDRVTITVDPETGLVTISNPAVTMTIDRNKTDRVELEDGTLAFDTDGAAGQAYRLYEAAFDRAPDPQGLGYWVRRLDEGGIDLEQLAELFLSSQEGQEVFAAEDDAAFVDQLYLNVLGREADPEGVAYWAQKLNEDFSKAELLAFFAEAEENVQNTAPVTDAGILFI